jgi:hypothetical protein
VGAPRPRIQPGFHRIEIRHPSYFSHYEEIQLSDGGEPGQSGIASASGLKSS